MIAQVVAVVALLGLCGHALGGGIGIGGLGIGGLGGGIGGLGGGIGGLGGGIGGLGGGIGGLSGIGGGYGGGRAVSVDLYAPPKYEFQYNVKDAHTGDYKQQAQVRVGDLTKDEYSLAENDRATRVGRIIAGGVPLVGKGLSLGGY